MYLLLTTFLISLTLGYSAIEWPVQDSIRLVNGGTHLEGRVEVYTGHEWGTVCDDDWDDVDAAVVCSELGYTSTGAKAFRNAHFGEGTGPVYFDDVDCGGHETKLGSCNRAMNCQHDEDAGVQCLEETFFTFGNERYSNNSLITIDVLESNSSTLKCTTENQACCTDFEVSWNYPNGSVINHTMTQNQSIILNITSELLISKGIYHCIIPGLSNVSNHLYIGIFEVSEGVLKIEDTYYNPQEGRIVCISSGGPVKRILWKKNGQELFTVDRNYEFSQQFIDRIKSTYKNSLKFVHKDESDSGNYSCEVSNRKGMASSLISVTACEQDSIRLQRLNGDTMLQVCYEDEWFEGVTINNIFFRNDTTSAFELEFTLSPQTNSVALYINSSHIYSTLIIDCVTEFWSSNSLHRNKYSKVTNNHSEDMIHLRGLLHNTEYQCCVTVIRDLPSGTTIPSVASSCNTVTTLGQSIDTATGPSATTIPSVTTSCATVTTLEESTDTAATRQVNILLGTLLGLVGLICLFTLSFVVIHLAKKCTCTKRELFGESVMRENPLYESATELQVVNAKSTTSRSHILNDRVEQTDRNHYYVDMSSTKSISNHYTANARSGSNYVNVNIEAEHTTLSSANGFDAVQKKQPDNTYENIEALPRAIKKPNEKAEAGNPL